MKTGKDFADVMLAIDKMGNFQTGFHEFVMDIYEKCKSDEEFFTELETLSILFSTYALLSKLTIQDLKSGKDKEDMIIDIYEVIKAYGIVAD